MKVNITFLALVLTCSLPFQESKAQSIGDYRSNITSGVLWTTPANWQVFNGTSWVTATQYPTAADGVITIQGSDSLTLNGVSINIDQVVVTTNAKLAMFTGTFTLLDVAAQDDLVADGRVYVGNGGILNGAGSILINAPGRFTVRNNARLNVASTVNNGWGEMSGNAFIDGGTYTSNLNFFWTATANSIALNNGATFNNNGFFSIVGSGTKSFVSSVAGGGTFNNNAPNGVIENNVGLFLNFNAEVNFNNYGTVAGTGTNTFSNVVTNQGTVAPGGNLGGTLSITHQLISAQPAIINMQILAAPGGGNDSLLVTTPGGFNVNLAGASLVVTDNDAAPAGTYQLMTIPAGSAGSFQNTFASTSIPANYASLTVTAKAVTVQKLYILPLTWGSFTARQNEGSVELNWSTIQEENVSHFVVEHSTDGIKYNAVGNVQAVGNSTKASAYSFVHPTPAQNARNYYRIKEVDVDSKSEYSIVRIVKIGESSEAAIKIRTNPVRTGVLELQSGIENGSVIINNLNGMVVKQLQLRGGINRIDINALPAGIYTVTVVENKARVFTGRVVKL